jgi:hypothetical protein
MLASITVKGGNLGAGGWTFGCLSFAYSELIRRRALTSAGCTVLIVIPISFVAAPSKFAGKPYLDLERGTTDETREYTPSVISCQAQHLSQSWRGATQLRDVSLRIYPFSLSLGG